MCRRKWVWRVTVSDLPGGDLELFEALQIPLELAVQFDEGHRRWLKDMLTEAGHRLIDHEVSCSQTVTEEQTVTLTAMQEHSPGVVAFVFFCRSCGAQILRAGILYGP